MQTEKTSAVVGNGGPVQLAPNQIRQWGVANNVLNMMVANRDPQGVGGSFDINIGNTGRQPYQLLANGAMGFVIGFQSVSVTNTGAANLTLNWTFNY